MKALFTLKFVTTFEWTWILCYSPLIELHVYRRVPSQPFIRQYSFIALSRERHCETYVSCPRHTTMTRVGIEPRPLGRGLQLTKHLANMS